MNDETLEQMARLAQPAPGPSIEEWVAEIDRAEALLAKAHLRLRCRRCGRRAGGVADDDGRLLYVQVWNHTRNDETTVELYPLDQEAVVICTKGHTKRVAASRLVGQRGTLAV